MRLKHVTPSRIYNTPTPSGTRRAPESQPMAPPFDVRENTEAFVLSTELPGVPIEDISIELTEGVLTISGEKKATAWEEGARSTRRERAFGQFNRAFKLPDHVDASAITADHANGVLSVSLPKRPANQSTEIPVKRA